MADAPDKPAGKSRFEVSALGFDALALVMMLATASAGVLLIEHFTRVEPGQPEWVDLHPTILLIAAWIAESIIGFWSGASIANRLEDPDYVSLQNSTAWAACWAAIPPVVFVLALGVLQQQRGFAWTAEHAILFTAGFVPGSVAGVVWWRRRGAAKA